MWKESNVQSASLSKAVLREKSVQGSSVSLPTCGSAVRESVFRPVAAEQRTHPQSGCTTLVKSVPVVERERERERVLLLEITVLWLYLSIYVSLCPFYYFLRMYSYQKYNVKRDTQFWLLKKCFIEKKNLYFILFFSFSAIPCGVWNLSSLTRDRTHASCISSTES